MGLVPSSVPVPRSRGRMSRRGVLGRIGAVTVGAVAASILTRLRAALADPFCCTGGGCSGSCVSATHCCWYCCYNSYLFKCGDVYENGSFYCVCAFFVSRC